MSMPDTVVSTKAGKLRGAYIDGVYRFLGVRYAAAPVGEYRFLPPQPLVPWEGEKLAVEMAPKCWQTDEPRMEDPKITATKYYVANLKLLTGSSEMGVGPQTEDCLALNIWTSGINDHGKRPVLVWFHGGGNIGGDAGAPWHDGYNLAKKQNIIVVNIGHRLNVFGYLHLAAFGNEKYKDSVNLGHQDMAAALQWIHDNIEAFGGDAGNVTIFGQSGGAEKVASLMAMPLAKGLFQKAIIQSGGFQPGTEEDAIKAAKDFFSNMNIAEDDLDALQKIPPEELIAAMRRINKTRDRETYLRFPIVADGKIIKYDPFDGAEGSEFCKDITLIMGNCKDDLRLFSLANPGYYEYTYDILPEKISNYGYTRKEADKVIEIYKNMLPGEVSACDVFVAFLTDQRFIKMINEWSAARKKVGSAPTYNYVFCFEGPDTDLKAIHGVDVPFFFDNAIYAPGIFTVDNRVGAMKLSECAGATWAAFARTGNPNNALIPTWRPYEEEERCTMLFDVEPRVVSDYRSEARKAAYHINL